MRICVHSGAQHLRLSPQSISAQTLGDFDLIVLD
jgi:hypothetical protein